MKDDPDFDDPSSQGSNNGLFTRGTFTTEGKEIDLIGRLALDMCQQERALLNGVPVHLKLWQNADSFRMMSPTADFKVKITDVYLKVALVKVNPAVLLSQTGVLKDTPALYPYTKSFIKSYAMSQGQYSFTVDDLFQGEIPKQLIVGVVSSSAHHGSYKNNPYNFQHFNCNYSGFFVDGQSVPTDPLQPNYKGDNFIDVYDRLYPDTKQRAVEIKRAEFKNGFCVYVFDIDGDHRDRDIQRGHTRLELKFTDPLPEPCTVILYAQFPALMKIDSNRNVTLE